MEMPLNISIEKMVANVRVTSDRPDNILAFGELWFYEQNRNNPLFKVKGFTIREKQFGDKTVKSVVFPAYGSSKSKTGYQTSFVFENASLLQDVRNLFLEEYYKQIGETLPFNENKEEEIDLEDIPF